MSSCPLTSHMPFADIDEVRKTWKPLGYVRIYWWKELILAVTRCAIWLSCKMGRNSISVQQDRSPRLAAIPHWLILRPSVDHQTTLDYPNLLLLAHWPLRLALRPLGLALRLPLLALGLAQLQDFLGWQLSMLIGLAPRNLRLTPRPNPRLALRWTLKTPGAGSW